MTGSLTALLLAAILAMRTPPPEAHARIVAESIALAAVEAPLWATSDCGDSPECINAGVAATAAVLLAIGAHESGFRVAVARCGITGDLGKSVGSFQIQAHAWDGHERGDVCADDALQARLALGALRRHWGRMRGVGLWCGLMAYASGDCGRKTKAGKELGDGAFLWCSRLGLVCDVYGRAMPRWKVTQ